MSSRSYEKECGMELMQENQKYPSISVVNPTHIFPVSVAQQRLWFLDPLEPDSATYNMPVGIRLRGLLDVSALEASLNALVQRHAVLRTTFTIIDGQPMQVIAPTLTLSLPVLDLRDFPETERESMALRLAREEAQRPFNLAQGPLVQTTLLRLNEEEYVLLLTTHQIIFDDWSTNVFIRELAVLYESFSVGESLSLPELPIQYADYVRWQQERLQGDVLATQRSFWKQQLSGAPARLSLPADSPRLATQALEGAEQSLVLPRALTEALQVLSQQEGVTPFMTLLAAFQILLQRYTGQEDLVVGTLIANRSQAEVEGLIGCFANTLMLRTNLSGNPSFRELLARVREVYQGAHADLPFGQFVEEMQPEQKLNRPPTCDVMINFINTPTIWELPGLTISSTQMAEPAAKCAMTLYVEAQASGLSLRLVYQRALFSSERIASVRDQFQYLLEQITTAPEKAIQLYSLVTSESLCVLPDPHTVLREPHYELITKIFASWAKRSPEQSAVRQKDRSWTYRELAESGDAIARSLLAQGLEPGDVVAVLGQQSFGLIASMIAALFSGGVLLTIDRNLPTYRQQLMLREARAKHLLYIGNWRPEDKWTREFSSLSILHVDPQEGQVVEPKSTLSAEPAQLPVLNPNAAAYIFFTSGTTGIPKGVLGCHKGLSHFLNWQRETFAVGQQDRSAQLTGLSFDVVLRDIFLPLTSGATLCLPAESDELGPDRILPWLEQEKITLLHTVPALAQSWLANIPSGISLRSLRWVFFAGEPLTDVLVQRWREAFPETGGIANFYGPTETSLAKCCHIVDSDPPPGVQPVGRPIPETQALILTESNQLCSIGELGEIVLRTPFRSLGYINAPEENRKRFIKNPFRDDEEDLLYRTGDRGRYRLDGSLEILGRLDHQVKIRGVRVEPDEVMATLLHHPGVKSCVVVAQKDKQGQNFLVAYVATSKHESVTSSELRLYLHTQLPSPMVPSVFVLLDALPLTPNGKVDRRALSELNTTTREDKGTFVAPTSMRHHQLSTIWEELLDVRPIGISDNFFYLGGHSLLAARMLDRIEHVFERRIALSTLFSGPTIAQLAEALEQQGKSHARTSILPVQAGGSRRPFFFLHGDWTGGAFYCFALARALGPDQPFYALEPCKFGGLQSLPSLEAVVAAHMEALRAIQPQGPYLLGGFCNGGVLAYEMARQLQEVGERIDFLALIDPSAPVRFKAMHAIGKRMSKLPGLRVDMQAQLFLRVRHAFRHVYRTLRPSGRRVQDFGKLLAIDSRLERMFPPVEALYNDYIGVFNWVVLRHETGVYPGKITFYWPSEEPFGKKRWLAVIKAKAGEEIEHHIVPGTHRSCVTEHVQDLAAYLSSCMSRVQEETVNHKVGATNDNALVKTYSRKDPTHARTATISTN